MHTKRRIAVLTTGRSDYGLLYWTLKLIDSDPDLELGLIVTGMHLSKKLGFSLRDIENDNFPIAQKITTLGESDSKESIGASIGQGTVRYCEALSNMKPDILLLLGDRTEILSAAVAALPLLIPVAHIHGGESSEGAIDENIRHAVSKLSHIHFTSTQFYAQRLIQMGEEPWRIHISGAPGIENIYKSTLPDKQEINRVIGIDVSKPIILMAYHPETITDNNITENTNQVLEAIRETDMNAVITYPNSDTGGQMIIDCINQFRLNYDKVTVVPNLGSNLYLALLKHTSVLIGNSSSGIIEAASFGTPVVNIGDRQKGRLRGENVIDVPTDKSAIVSAIHKAMSLPFGKAIRSIENIYDHGIASETIVNVLKSVELGPPILRKRFVDLPLTLQHKPPGSRN
tara:strand:- start:445 stop:1644 length:1200 start_codon:yes stop_codon:yes gene_type:complete